MRVFVAIVAMTLSEIAMPLLAQENGSTRFPLNEQFALPDASGSDIEKLRTARYGLRDPNDDYFEPAADELRFRWKFNRVKVRVPFSTSRLQ